MTTTSTAILAQGSVLSIAGTPGTPVACSAITKGIAGAVTLCSAAVTTGVSVGSVVVFASATGMPEIVGRIGIVTAVVASTSFSVNIDSSGFAANATAASAVPQTWVKINNLKDFNAFEGQVSEIDKTNLSSLAKEVSPGLEDFGTIAGTVDLSPVDPGQIAMMLAKSAQTITYFLITYPSATVQRALQGFVKKFGEQGAVDGVIKSAYEVRATGRVCRTEIIN